MANPADEFSSADLEAALAGGLVNEDVMQEIWNISHIPLPFTDIVGTDTHSRAFSEWTIDELAAPDLTNSVVDGSDATGNQAKAGTRVGNYSQTSDKVVSVSTRARNVDTIGKADELLYQLSERQMELMHDLEAISLSPQASRADDGDSIDGKTGTYPSWLETNVSLGTGGAVGGFNTGTKIVDAPTEGDGRVFTQTLLEDAIEAAYIENGNVTHIMSTPQLVRRLNTFLLGSGANIATLTANIDADSPADMVAQAAVHIYRSNFNTTLIIEPNRKQQTYLSGDTTPVPVVDVFLIDPSKVAISKMNGVETNELGKRGLYDEWQMSTDWMIKVYNEKAHALIRDILPTGTVTA